MIQHSFYGEENRKFPYLRLLNNYFNFHPKLRIDKFKYLLNSKKYKRPLIGYIHIPKTGGTYTSSINDDLPHLNFSHVLIREDMSDKYCPIGLCPMREKWIKKFFLFITVRNPLYFLRSYYHHVIGFGKHVNKNHYDYSNAQKGFEYLVDTILNRENVWPYRKFLFPQIFDQNNFCRISWINRMEELDNDLNYLCKFLGYKNFASQNKRRVSPKTDIKAYYNDRLIEEIVKTYSREMKLFGYNLFHSKIPLIQLKPLSHIDLKYDYLLDELFINNNLMNRNY